MKTVKTYLNLAEAGFAASLLEAAGIQASIADEQTYTLGYQTGAIGLRLQVEDQDFERAQAVLAEGPDATPRGNPVADEPPVKTGNLPIGLFVLIIALLGVLGLIGRYALEQRRAHRETMAEQTYAYDVNHDGKPDVWFTYRRGVIVSSEHDTDFDGLPDLFSRYEDGVIAETEVRPGNSKIVVRKWIYVHGVEREEWVDEDADGTFDYKILIDPFGARSDRIPLPAAK